MKLFDVLFICSFFVLCYIIVLIISSLSSYSVYVGDFNNTNLEIAKSVCGDDFFVGIDGGCNRLSTYCERFYFPVHVFYGCYDGRMNVIWRSWKNVR